MTEISKGIFQKYNVLHYMVHIDFKRDSGNNKFLFINNSLSRELYKYSFLKNVFSCGYGYQVFSGPIYFAYLNLAPSIYYITNLGSVNVVNISAYCSGIYSYKLINNIYYSQYFEIFVHSNHIINKFEHALNFYINSDFSIKILYNITRNENKLFYLFPNINRHIAISMYYSL